MKKKINNFFVSMILVTRNMVGLILFPYKTMRRISSETDLFQIGIMFILTYSYFILANIIRRKTLHPFVISSSSLVTFVFFLITFFFVISFFSITGRITHKKVKDTSLLFTFAYSLFPTIIWFFTTSLLYLLLPPPRTVSILGQALSVVFIIFSLSILLWRSILLYLSIRFSLKTDFYETLFFIALFLVWFLPYSYGLYYLKIFRVPFI